MANEMNRTFEFEGRKFNVKVTLNHLTERRRGGLSIHKVVINDMGPSNWFYEQACTTEQLERTVRLCESKAKDHVLGIKNLSPEERILSDMGFK